MRFLCQIRLHINVNKAERRNAFEYLNSDRIFLLSETPLSVALVQAEHARTKTG